MNQKAKGYGAILFGGIIELVLAILGIATVVLYVSNSSPELLQQLNLTEAEGVKAMFGLYGVTALHVIAAIIAFIFKNRPHTYLPILIIGLLLIIFFYINVNWEASNPLQIFINTLSGAILIYGAMVRKKSLSK